MNEYDLAAVPFPKNIDQPIVETTDVKNCHELRVHLGELRKRPDLFGAGTNPLGQHRFSVFVADTSGDLLGVLVDCEA